MYFRTGVSILEHPVDSSRKACVLLVLF